MVAAKQLEVSLGNVVDLVSLTLSFRIPLFILGFESTKFSSSIPSNSLAPED